VTAAPRHAGRGDLMVAPTRLVFEGTTRSASVDLMNTGAAPTLYRISLDRMRMLEDGRIVAVDEPLAGERFANGLVIHSPRQVLLQPGVAQTVRLLVRRPADLPAGEYRSHLTFRAVPTEASQGAALLDAQEPAGTSGAMSVSLLANLGISIPVIVRQGPGDARVSVTELTLEAPSTQGAPATLRLELAREGNVSVYGDLVALLHRGLEAPRTMGLARGVAVYAPNTSRSFQLALPAVPGDGLHGGEIVVEYRAGGRGALVLASRRVDLP